MKVLVTGGAGFVGTNLIKRLIEDGHNVVVLDNYSTGYKENEQEGCKYFSGDIREIINFDFFIEKPDVIFHLAALARIQPSFLYPAPTFETNVYGTQNLLEWARSNNTPVVYAGSSSTHGDHFANPYTFTKWQAELLVEMYNKVYNLPTVITRFYNVYGEHQILDGAYAAVVGVFERQYKAGEPLTITGDGQQRRDFTYVGDIVDGLLRCADNIDAVNGKTLELGRGKNYSINEIAKFYNTEIKYLPKRPGEMETTLCESKEARELIGFNPKVDIKDYVSRWLKDEN